MGIIKHPTVCPVRPKLEKAPAKKPLSAFQKGGYKHMDRVVE
jgi:hypothetical protein